MNPIFNFKPLYLIVFIFFLFINRHCFAQEDLNFGAFGGDDDSSVFMNEKPSKKKSKKPIEHWGFGLGITPTFIQIQDSTSNRNLKGNNFVVKLSYDRPIKKKVNLLLGTSLLPLSGSQPDSQLGTAKFEANYLALELMGRINLSPNSMEGLWIGGGLDYLFLLGKASSNVIDTSSVKSRLFPQISIGYNYSMAPEYLTFRFDWLLHTQNPTSGGSVNITQYILSAIYYY